MERIVVGIDGSPGSEAALQWAIDEAKVRGARVDAIHAFHVPYNGGSAAMPLMLDHEEFRTSGEAVLHKVVGAADASGLAVPVTELVVEGPSSTVLVEAGRSASMIVVGARGHGGLTGMLMGSVSRQVAEHASVPVVVVPAPETEATPGS